MPSVKHAALAAVLALGLATPAIAQSLSPLEKSGVTPSDRKAFRLTIGNPYPKRMTFDLIPYEANYQTPARNVVVNYPTLTMAPGFTRKVIVTFSIDPNQKERTIALCVSPKAVDGPILPRVCGLYTGRMAGAGG